MPSRRDLLLGRYTLLGCYSESSVPFFRRSLILRPSLDAEVGTHKKNSASIAR